MPFSAAVMSPSRGLSMLADLLRSEFSAHHIAPGVIDTSTYIILPSVTRVTVVLSLVSLFEFHARLFSNILSQILRIASRATYLHLLALSLAPKPPCLLNADTRTWARDASIDNATDVRR